MISSLLSFVNVIPAKLVDQLETPRWILLTVCVVGVVLAYVTDEEYSLLVDDEGRSSVSDSGISALKARKGGRAGRLVSDQFPCGTCSVVRVGALIGEWITSSALALRTSLPESLGVATDQLAVNLQTRFQQLGLVYKTFLLKRQAKTRRQFNYFLFKQSRNQKVKPGETEVDTYLDVKNGLGNLWPFSWEVSNVRNEKINCSGYECIPMSSYSYLGLISDPRVQNAAIEAAQIWSSGNHGPRMLGGSTTILRELENVVTAFFGREDTLLCATGFLACMSACAAVSTSETVVFADSRLHASLTTGLKIGEGKVVWFRHNNFEDCEAKIKKFRHRYSNAWMVLESVYSMDGDICDLPAANSLCQKYDIKLMIDEAHSLGVVGKTGRGVEEHFNLQGCCTLIVGTFSKSIASIGGYITGTKRFISYLDFHAPGNVFSAPLPAYCAGAAIKAFQLIDEEPHLVTKAQEMSTYLRNTLQTGAGLWPADYPQSFKYEVAGNPASTVLPLIFPDDMDRVVRVATTLKRKGYMCSAVAYPACSLRRPRFRMTATAAYTTEIINQFVKTLVETCIQEGPSDLKKKILSTRF